MGGKKPAQSRASDDGRERTRQNSFNSIDRVVPMLSFINMSSWQYVGALRPLNVRPIDQEEKQVTDAIREI
jgi:hypothetical protein